MPDYALERRLGGPARTIAGIDEAGRGPLAGPVVAAAVVLDTGAIPAGLDDSKKLAPARRAGLYAALQATAAIGIGIAEVAEIDRLNILGATMVAMRRALDALPAPPDMALVDGNRLPDLPCPAEAVVKGDARSLSIAAASIAAKVTRDRIMADLARRHPGYGWERNAGYPTAAHREAMHKLGLTPHHRMSFAPVRAIASQDSCITN